ncbi:hypothetical protein C8R46DRAFT_377304 [Mycena filopes]|nr:hypothetical protein C8R46DRAFT_377304 [Mycena filopes]
MAGDPARQRRLAGAWKFAYFSFLLSLLIMAAFNCSAPSCQLGAKSAAALHRHQSTCPAYMDFLEAVTPKSAAVARGGPLLKPKHRVPAGKNRPPTLAARKARSATPGENVAGPSSASGSGALPATPPRGPSPSPDLDISIPDDFPPVEQLLLPDAPPASDPEALGRGKRGKRLPARFRDVLPEVAPIEEVPPEDEEEPTAPPRRVRLIVRDTFETTRNMFALWRSYLHRPTHDPDSLISAEDLSNQYPAAAPEAPPAPSQSTPSAINASTSLLLQWQNNGQTTKSAAQLNSLVHDVLLHPEFKVDELQGFNAERAEKQADKEAAQVFPLLRAFKTASVEIEVPSGSPRFHLAQSRSLGYIIAALWM